MIEELITQKGKVKLTKGLNGAYAVTSANGEMSYFEVFLEAYFFFLDESGWKDKQ